MLGSLRSIEVAQSRLKHFRETRLAIISTQDKVKDGDVVLEVPLEYWTLFM